MTIWEAKEIREEKNKKNIKVVKFQITTIQAWISNKIVQHNYFYVPIIKILTSLKYFKKEHMLPLTPLSL